MAASGLVKGMDKVGEIAEDDIKVMMDTNVTGLINVPHPLPVPEEVRTDVWGR